MHQRFCLYFLAFALLAGVEAQKKILKQAVSLESSGLYAQAADKYMEALYQNATKPESIQGLKRTSQKTIDGKLSEFFIQRNSENYEEAIEIFDAVEKYQAKLNYFGIKGNIPNYYYEDYRTTKEQLVESLVAELNESIASQENKRKQDLIEKIKIYDPSFDQSKVNDMVAGQKLEPTYQSAVTLYERQDFVGSWKKFAEVDKLESNYKKTEFYKSEIRSNATTLAIVLAERNRFSEVEYFKDNIIAELSQLEIPIVKIVDRDDLDQIIEEQKLGLSGLIDERSAAQLGRILGAQDMLFLKTLDYSFIEGGLSKKEATAYTSKSNIINQQSFEPVPYRAYKQSNKLLVSVQYKLIDSSTGEILDANILRSEYEDKLNYAKYPGDHNMLYPAQDGYIYKSGTEREDFLKLFEERTTPLSKKEIEFKVQEQLSKEVVGSLGNYFLK